MKTFDARGAAIAAITFVGACLFTYGAVTLFAYKHSPMDDTDPPDGRSGMNLHTDAMTGCQYLSRGSLTPRLDADGKHICNRKESK